MVWSRSHLLFQWESKFYTTTLSPSLTFLLPLMLAGSHTLASFIFPERAETSYALGTLHELFPLLGTLVPWDHRAIITCLAGYILSHCNLLPPPFIYFLHRRTARGYRILYRNDTRKRRNSSYIYCKKMFGHKGDDTRQGSCLIPQERQGKRWTVAGNRVIETI